MDHCPLMTRLMDAMLQYRVTPVISCLVIEFLCVLQGLGLEMWGLALKKKVIVKFIFQNSFTKAIMQE